MPLVGLYQWGPIFFPKITGEARQTIFLVDDMTLTREEIGFSAFSIIIVSTILYASWEPSSWWGAVISLWTQTQIVETLVPITPCVMLLQHPKAVQKCPTNSSANWSTGQHEGGTTDGDLVQTSSMNLKRSLNKNNSTSYWSIAQEYLFI